jgi:hypothetical protein
MGFFGSWVAPRGGISKTKLLIGAGGLLLFIIGLKRSHRLDSGASPVLREPTEGEPDGESAGGSESGTAAANDPGR